MADQIHTRRIGTVTYQGTEADLRAWGVWKEPRRPVCIDCIRPEGQTHEPTCPFNGLVTLDQTIDPRARG